MRKTWRVVAISLICLTVIGLAACRIGGGDVAEASRQLVEVVRGDLTISVSGSGNISAARDELLKFGSSGRVEKVSVKENDRVVKGEVLARLDISPLELALAQAEASLSQARLTQMQLTVTQVQAEAALVQAQSTLNQATISLNQLKWFLADSDDRVKVARAQFDAARAQVEATQAQLDIIQAQSATIELQIKAAEQNLAQAQKQLSPERVTITAPFDGVVVSVDIDEGESVSATVPAIHLIDLNSRELKAVVDEIDISLVKPGQKAIIKSDALPSLQLEGKVDSISLLPTVQSGLVAYKVTIRFALPGDSDLRVGMSASTDIIVEERSNVLLVPDRAIRHDSQGNPVVAVMVGEQVQERPVVIGISDGFQTEITSGLAEGETVVIENVSRTDSTGSGGLFFGG